MSKEMSEEAFNEIVDGFEYIRTLTEWGSKNIKQHIQRLQQENQHKKEVIDKVYVLIKQHIRKDGFLELNEWQTRDLLKLLKEVSE